MQYSNQQKINEQKNNEQKINEQKINEQSINFSLFLIWNPISQKNKNKNNHPCRISY